MKTNHNYEKINDTYLFSKISKKVNAYVEKNPHANIIKLGIGDVTLPICDEVGKAMELAVKEMLSTETFKGYGEEQGYLFLRKAICDYYLKKGIKINENEVFISDGAKSDLGNILDLFSKDNIVLIQRPVYPVYVDTNIMDGRKIIYMDGIIENEFLPLPDENVMADVIYLCSPNNPTGACYNKEQLKKWVDYALKNDSIILFDAAYEAFISNDCPSSIFEIEGANKCAIEFCSLSKTAGFTGIRCGYTVVPSDLIRDNSNLNKMWLRRQTTKFNGVSYITQRGAEAVFTPKGLIEIKENIDYYKENAKIISDYLKEMNIWFCGGQNSPYIWMKCPREMNSWEFFDFLLENAMVVGTPGEGFGGEGFFRLTSFNTKEKTIEAMERIKKVLFNA